jgi:hypothetical protein
MHDVNLELWNGEDLLRTMTDHRVDVAVSKMVEGAGPMIQIERASSMTRLMKRTKEIA